MAPEELVLRLVVGIQLQRCLGVFVLPMGFWGGHQDQVGDTHGTPRESCKCLFREPVTKRQLLGGQGGYLFIYLAALGLSRGTWTLSCGLWDLGPRG